MLINASLTRPCVQKLQALAHGRISNKLKAAALAPFAGIALPFGDACMHSALAVVKTPFLVAPLSIGRLAGKGFVSSLDRRSPRQALLSQMAFHVVRSLASLTLLAVSALAIPTIPFLVLMPRIVSKTHDRLGLNRLFKTRIAPKTSPVKPAVIVYKVALPSKPPMPLAEIECVIPQKQVIPPTQLSKPALPIVPQPIVKTTLPPVQLPQIPAPAVATVLVKPISAPVSEADPAQIKQTKGKEQKRVVMADQSAPKAKAHKEADRIKSRCKKVLSKSQGSDAQPMEPLAAPPVPHIPAASQGSIPQANTERRFSDQPMAPLATASPVPPISAASQESIPQAVTEKQLADSLRDHVQLAYELQKSPQEAGKVAADALGSRTTASIAQHNARKVKSSFKKFTQPPAVSQETEHSAEPTPTTSPKGPSSLSETPQEQSARPGKAKRDSAKIKNALKIVTAGQNPNMNLTITAILSGGKTPSTLNSGASATDQETFIKTTLRKSSAKENEIPA